jgi:hypothetical protein
MSHDQSSGGIAGTIQAADSRLLSLQRQSELTRAFSAPVWTWNPRCSFVSVGSAKTSMMEMYTSEFGVYCQRLGDREPSPRRFRFQRRAPRCICECQPGRRALTPAPRDSGAGVFRFIWQES